MGGLPGPHGAGRLHAVGHPRVSLVAGDATITRRPKRTSSCTHDGSRHAVLVPAVVVGTWYGLKQRNRRVRILAGVGALAWFLWPEASWSLTWCRRRRTEDAGARIPRAVSRALRDGTETEEALASPCGASECSEGRI